MYISRILPGTSFGPIALIVFVLLISSEVAGQGNRNLGPNYETGDRVQVRRGNKWIAGEVVETTRGGLVKVRMTESGGNRVVPVPERLVRSVGAKTKAPATDSRSASDRVKQLRTWTDSTGIHKVEAEFVEVTDGNVNLRKDDGSLAVLPLDRLCKEDQEFIASLAADGFDSPEDVLRQFLVALASGNRRQTVALMVPHSDAAILFQGQVAPPQVAAQMKRTLEAEEIRRLNKGDSVSLPGGETMDVSSDDVSADRVLLQIPNHPVPDVVLRRKNGWRVDAAPLIQARKAAQAIRDNKGPAAHDEGGGSVAADQPKEWPTITALEDRVRIQMPGQATKAEQVLQTTQGPVTFVVYKYAARGRFWNFNLVTYPEQVVESATDKTEFLQRIGLGTMRGKTGSQQLSMETLKESADPAIRLAYRYPPGRNAAGEYGGGQATHELYLLGNQVVWVFVDVLDVAREAEAAKVDAQIKQFFASLVLPKD